MPIPYIQRTRERYADHPPYRWAVNHDAPWTPLAKPIKDCRIALLSSGGFYLPTQEPFKDHDVTYRLIPKDTDLSILRVHHHGYRDNDADEDPNIVLPVDRFKELEAVGVIRELADPIITFLYNYSAKREARERAPKIAEEVKRMGVDAAFLVPV